MAQNIQVTRVSSKGQIVIPNKMRSTLGIIPGAELLVFTDGVNVLLKPIQPTRVEEFNSLIKASRQFAKKARLKKSQIQKSIKQTRNESRA